MDIMGFVPFYYLVSSSMTWWSSLENGIITVLPVVTFSFYGAYDLFLRESRRILLKDHPYYWK